MTDNREQEDWVWMPHPGHYICAYKCHFQLNTYVGGYIVSTVGEMTDTDDFHRRKDTQDWEEIGVGRKYETMVFRAVKSEYGCCPWEQDTGEDVDMDGYNSAEDAYRGHLEMCKKWAKQEEETP